MKLHSNKKIERLADSHMDDYDKKYRQRFVDGMHEVFERLQWVWGKMAEIQCDYCKSRSVFPSTECDQLECTCKEHPSYPHYYELSIPIKEEQNDLNDIWSRRVREERARFVIELYQERGKKRKYLDIRK